MAQAVILILIKSMIVIDETVAEISHRQKLLCIKPDQIFIVAKKLFCSQSNTYHVHNWELIFTFAR